MSHLILIVALAVAPGLADLRANHQAAQQSVLSTDAKIELNQSQLDRLAQRIVELKQQGTVGPFVSGELDQALRQSQVLSSQLDGLRSRRAVDAASLSSAQAALYQALGLEIAQVRRASEATGDVSSRSALLEGLRHLELERSQLDQSLRDERVVSLSSSPTDDPKELQERADALKDRADRLGRELEAVKSRIQDLRDERDLDRELRTLSRDQGLFDEADSRVRSSHTDSLVSPVAVAPASQHGGTPGATSTQTTLPPPTSPTQTAGSHTTAGQTIAGGATTGTDNSMSPSIGATPGVHIDGSPSASPTPGQVSVSRSGELVQVGTLSTAVLPDDASLESLIARQKSLEAERAKLESQASQLESSAHP